MAKERIQCLEEVAEAQKKNAKKVKKGKEKDEKK